MSTMMEKREIGHPWFCRHAMRGAREIFEFIDHSAIKGALWEDRDAMLDYYHKFYEADRMDESGMRGITYFDSWEEAEEWLREVQP